MDRKDHDCHPNQFHPAFCSAVEIDFRNDIEHVSYVREWVLNTMPNRIDLLMIKKKPAVLLKNEIGAIFRRYNIFEFKAPHAALNEKAFYMTNAYANLMVAYDQGPKSLDEITVSLLRDEKPVKFMRFLRDYGFIINVFSPGIYHVTGNDRIGRQIIVTSELKEEHRWLKAITYRLSPESAGRLMLETEGMNTGEKINALSVLSLISGINSEYWEGDEDMGPFTQAYNDALSRNKELCEQLQSKDEMLKSSQEQLQCKEEQLQTSQEENARLHQEIRKLQEKLNKIAMF